MKITKLFLLVSISLGLVFGPAGCSKPKSDGAAETGQANQITISQKIDSKVFVANLRRLGGPKPGESNQALLARYFVDNGVKMDPPSAVLIDEIGSRVLVRATEPDRAKILTLLQHLTTGQ